MTMESPRLLTWIELSRKALRRNIGSLAKLADGRILAPSVKANAYGHGLSEIVGLLEKLQACEYVTTHSLDEAIACRRAGWSRKIMVLGPLPPDDLSAVLKHDLEPVICETATLRKLGRLGDRAGQTIRTHLKLETGTNRQGLSENDLPAAAKVYQAHKSLGRPHGASMHFANIEDTTSHDYAEFQLANYRHLLSRLKQLGIAPRVRHTASSAATILFDKTRFELVRPGIAVYGHWPSKETYLSYRLLGGANDLFEPILSWKTRITQIKQVPADSFVGYGCTFRTTAPTRLAILPVGYFEGYARSLSNRSYVLIHGRRAPVRGRICMNLMMVDITDIKGVRLHDTATLIGCDGDDRVTAEQVGEWAGTINYEVLARLSPTISRIIVD